MTLTHVVRILHITMSLPICPAHKYQMTYMSYTLELHVYPITIPGKMISRMCTTLLNISGILC